MTRRLRICAVGDPGSVHFVNRTRCFAERGHAVTLLCDRPSGASGLDEVMPEAPEPEAFPPAVKLLVRLFAPFFPKGLDGYVRALYRLPRTFELLRRIDPDVVHIHYVYAPLAWIVALSGRHPLVAGVMGGDVLFREQGSPTFAGKLLTLFTLDQADRIMCKSARLADVVGGYGPFAEKTVKVSWGVDLARFRRTDASLLRERLGIAPSAPVIFSPKIMREFYNIHHIVEAMPLVLESIPDAVLVVPEFGADPGYRARIHRLVRALGIASSVRFTGAIPHQEMPSYYSLADVTVAVPSSDGMPQALFEGMACAVPNILSKLSIYREVVSDGESAVFVDIEAAAIAHGVVQLLSDGALRERITAEGLRIVTEQADFERDVRRVEQEYLQLAGCRRERDGAVRVASRIVSAAVRCLRLP